MYFKAPLLLFLSPSSSLGGAERVLINNLKSLLVGNFRVKQKVVFVEDGPLVQEVSQLGVPAEIIALPLSIRRLGDSPSRNDWLIIRLIKLFIVIPVLLFISIKWKTWLRKEDPTWIHSNGFKTHILAALWSPGKTPILWHIHDFVGERPLIRWLLKWSWRPGIQAIAISRSVADDFHKKLPECPVMVWTNTVDCQKFLPRTVDGGWLDVEAGFEDGFQGLRFGLVSTYARWKGQDVFLQACQILSEKFNNRVRFYLIGGPIYQTTGSQWTIGELIERVKDLNLFDRVGLVPFQKEMSKVYQSLDVVVHASIRPEPFGLVIAEAMACGKPVVASLHGGAAEIGEDGIHCVGHEPGNPSSLAAAMELLILDEARRNELGARARDRVLRYFGAEKMLDNWLDLLREGRV